ncbi:MAG: hypothetical protein RL260_2991, partial [Pseudomonadota bacterium]
MATADVRVSPEVFLQMGREILAK